ncbi:MAG: signal peptidase I [Candidatus Hydrogenedentes bacterium]|nr:signal peptidase I [Candidatus Hydrogenedentota bacterium]
MRATGPGLRPAAEPMNKPEQGPRDDSNRRVARRLALGWAKVVAALLIFLWLFVQSYVVPTDSMEPALHGGGLLQGDRILVNKLVFGPRIPFSNIRILPFAEPKRWDIVAFRSVEPGDAQTVYVKRVVGLPGERIRIADGRIQVNGEVLDPPPPLRDTLSYLDPASPTDVDIGRLMADLCRADDLPGLLNPDNPGVQVLQADIERFRASLASAGDGPLLNADYRRIALDMHNTSRVILNDMIRDYYCPEAPLRYGLLEDDAYSLVPDGCYFVLGDNSPHSRDGRSFGWVPHGHLLGRAFGVSWPPSRWRDLSGFTQTWWGLLLLFAVPGAMGVYEAVRIALRARRRRRSPAPE